MCKRDSGLTAWLVKLKDGTRLQETVEAPRGSEKSFASEADIVGKFMKLSTHTVGREQANRIVELVLCADKLVRADESCGRSRPERSIFPSSWRCRRQVR